MHDVEILDWPTVANKIDFLIQSIVWSDYYLQLYLTATKTLKK